MSDLAPNEDELDVKKRNEALLLHIANEINGVVLSLPKALEEMSQLRAPGVLQRPVFQGLFEVTEEMQFRVKVFLKTKRQAFPTMKKVSLVAQKMEDPDTDEVEMDRTYCSIEDLDTPINKADIVKGYKYGRSLVPITKIDESVLKYSCVKCLQLIGFTKASNVSRHHYLGSTEVVSPLSGDEKAIVAMSALVRAMVETESIGIARYCPRADSVKIVALVPHVSADQEDLYLHQLPFADDLRHFPFPPLDPKRARSSIVPTQDQLSAVDDLIDQLDLSQAGENEEG